MKNSDKRKVEVSLDINCTDDIPCNFPLKVKVTGLIIFLVVLFLIV